MRRKNSKKQVGMNNPEYGVTLIFVTLKKIFDNCVTCHTIVPFVLINEYKLDE